MRAAFFLLLVLLSPRLYAQSQLQSLIIKSDPKASYLSFHLSQKTKGRVKLLPTKQVLMVEFANTSMAFKVTREKEPPIIRDIRVKKLKSRLQIFLSLKHPVKWQVQYAPLHRSQGAQLKLTLQTPAEVFKKTARLRDQIDQVLKTTPPTLSVPKTPVTSNVKPFVIVIDAGHGGKDAGALGRRGTKEKVVVLNVAQRLAKKINQSSSMRAVLTRNSDRYIPLRQRLKLARKGEADIFIAIHADAFFEKRATGASVYALSKRGATTEAARWLAQASNYNELSDVQLDALQDRSVILRSVLIDLAQTTTIRDSLLLGNKILNALDDFSPMHFKRVQQAPFVVLKSPDIPSVLIETGFITNPQEEARLNSPTYQQALADGIYRGIYQYYQAYGRHD